jgi:hypothetical protein
MKEIGCTTPFGYNKTHICVDVQKAQKAYKKLEETVLLGNPNCLRPCVRLLIMPNNIATLENLPEDNNGLNVSRSVLNFDENVKVMVATELYSILSLIAEIGGYVGLFLGVSINQITQVIDGLSRRLYKKTTQL